VCGGREGGEGQTEGTRISSYVYSSVPDPQVLKPPGSFHHQAKTGRQTFIQTVLWLLYNYLSLKKSVFVGVLKVTDKKSRIRWRIRSHRPGAKPNPLVTGTDPRIWNTGVRGASKIILKKVNKKRTVTVRRVIIFLNISRRPLLICLHCCLHQYKTLKAVATAIAAIVVLSHFSISFWMHLVLVW